MSANFIDMNDSQLESLERKLCNLPIIKKELERLERELAPSLKYHSVLHTKDVLHECLLFGLHDGLSEDELELLAIAAAFHDSGFLIKPLANERLGADLAAAAMEEIRRYTRRDIEVVSQMIVDTEIYWKPEGPVFNLRTRLSGYLLDADLSNFGREDFFEKSKLFAEETNQSLDQVNSSLIIFLKSHKWHTAAAYNLRQAQKEKNLLKLLESL